MHLLWIYFFRSALDKEAYAAEFLLFKGKGKKNREMTTSVTQLCKKHASMTSVLASKDDAVLSLKHRYIEQIWDLDWTFWFFMTIVLVQLQLQPHFTWFSEKICTKETLLAITALFLFFFFHSCSDMWLMGMLGWWRTWTVVGVLSNTFIKYIS